ncbi:MAG: hypothetical protein ACKVH8_17665 [Pirellulales bacterium]
MVICLTAKKEFEDQEYAYLTGVDLLNAFPQLHFVFPDRQRRFIDAEIGESDLSSVKELLSEAEIPHRVVRGVTEGFPASKPIAKCLVKYHTGEHDRLALNEFEILPEAISLKDDHAQYRLDMLIEIVPGLKERLIEDDGYDISRKVPEDFVSEISIAANGFHLTSCFSCGQNYACVLDERTGEGWQHFRF